MGRPGNGTGPSTPCAASAITSEKRRVVRRTSIRAGAPPPVPGLAGLQELQFEAALRRSMTIVEQELGPEDPLAVSTRERYARVSAAGQMALTRTPWLPSSAAMLRTMPR